MSAAALDIIDLTIGYESKDGSTIVAGGINAALGKGELVALVGRNGAGKSTLLRTLAAYNRPLDGCITYDGDDVSSLSMQQLAKKISVVLTAATPVANMSVRELVSLGRTPHTNFLGLLTDNDRMVVEQAMETMGVAQFASRDIFALSDGERQKCMIAKALAQQTPLIMLDEPTAYLDYPSKVRLMRMLKHLAATEGKGVIVSTHDLDIALRLANKMWLMHGGRLVAGSVAELSAGGALSAFIDDEGVCYNVKENCIEFKNTDEIRF